MARGALSAKVICFTCRESNCGCVAMMNRSVPGLRRTAPSSEATRVFAWLGGACVAGTALGAALALLFS